MKSIKTRLWHNMTATIVVLAGTMAPSVVFGQITFFVDSLADDSLQASNGTLCTSTAGECTFRAALEAANNRSDTVTIDFATGIPVDAANRSIISPSTPLPAISSQVIIRGETHPNFSASEQLPRFLIDGDESVSFGLLLANGSQDSEVRFIAIYNALQIGIRLDETSGVTLLGNHIGLRPLINNTSEIQGNGAFGIWVTASNDNTIENNWVSGNGFQGVIISHGSADNLLIGNRIGQLPTFGGTGVAVAGNGDAGIQVNPDAGSGNLIGNCSGFPTEICRGNIITANDGAGIRLMADGQQVQANFIGITPNDPDNDAYGNAAAGILVESSDNTIFSGLTVRQSIRFNGGAGISLSSSGNQVSGNLVRSNGSHGIAILNGGQEISNNIIGDHNWGIAIAHPIDATPDGLVRILNNRIGISQANEPIPNNWGIVGWEGGFSRIGDANQGNIIAFNTSGGIYFNETEASSIQANWIGILPDGTPAGNDGPGILVTVVSDGGIGGSKRIGYTAQDTIPAEHVETADAMGNVIAYNIDGVLIHSSQDNFSLNNNPVRGNRFIANSGQAINLGPDGDVIDPGGDAEGPNNLQNFPVFNPDFTFYDADQNLLYFTFSVNTSPLNATYPLLIDLYLADGSSRQGRYFLGTAEYQSFDAPADAGGSLTPPEGLNLEGAYLVATATDSDGNTSQFSEAILLTEPVDEIFQDRFEEAEE